MRARTDATDHHSASAGRWQGVVRREIIDEGHWSRHNLA